MKDLIQKLTDLQETAEKRKMLTEDTTTRSTDDKPQSLKDVFETIAGMKPIPVVGKEGGTQQTGSGFVNVTDPALQSLGKTIGDLAAQKKLQIVVPTASQTSSTVKPTGTVGATPGGQGQAMGAGQAMQEEDINEKWGEPTKVSPGEKGKYAGKNKSELTKQYNKLKASGPHKKGSPEYSKMRELSFAIRAKSDWGKVQEAQQVDEKFASQQQAKLMYAAAGDKDVAKKTGVSQKVAKEFVKKSHGQKVSKLPKKVDEAHTGDEAEKKFNKYNTKELDYMLDRAYGRSKPGDAHKQMRAGQAKNAAYNVMWRKKYKDTDFDLEEADIPSTQGIDTRGAGLGAGRSPTTLEGKKSKPDFLDFDKDGNKEEPMKKAIKDKKKVNENILNRISAARLEGRSHGLKNHSHCGKNYDDMEEMRAYHEGYKEGLDECYGMGVYEAAPVMDDMDEGNAFTAALARTPKGGKFSVGGKTFTDRSRYDSPLDEYAFESWNKQLDKLINEGVSVSINKGLEGGHDSATVTATDGDAENLLAMIKQAGLGVFGDDQGQSDNSMVPDDGNMHGGIEVVGDHDGMMGIMKKLANVQASGSEDYADEEDSDCGCQDEEMSEARCDECGMLESKCGCENEQVDEVETEDQMTAQVAEDESGQEEMGQTEADEDKALATSDAAEDEEEEVAESFTFENLARKLAMLAEDSDDDEEDVTEAKEDDEEEDEEDVTEDLNEWANGIGGKGKDAEGKGTDAAFERDIEFMTKIIAGGLNKPKSTGQTTIPVIAGQDNRTEQPSDWATLAGIK